MKTRIAVIATVGLLLAGAAYAADPAKTAKPMKEPVRHTFQVAVDGKIVKFDAGQDEYVFNLPDGGTITVAASSFRQKIGDKVGLKQKRWTVTLSKAGKIVSTKVVGACTKEPGSLIGVDFAAMGDQKVCSVQ